ncbi:secreted nucleotidyl transferase [Phycomyces blakesleeanus]|uniref:Secreted nucleotidyl transferase n=2 Tax=Phycomyces blakesleeanus TaxID=4837 RepID=A0A162TN43_PHYB8|nr:secreted nucleotidyl transferase [Phycomyces blakesleeanus NRRL 1555(-)]OAD68493.1 secreted nucleotidyl transferase [Phycomyces blakesleeanus NRRL 1555(-)]|eukprot:XP_018286533.1 secreted nucleotidyl transferase [Phycomyces blakesleeanus NRRL 1555(-)]
MVIKVLLLVAGYGTRLQQDLRASPSHHHLLGVPKALLPLGQEDALITYWLDLFKASGIPASDIYLVTNAASYSVFVSWANRHQVPLVNVFNDGTMSNEDRLGAVPDINLAVKHFGLGQDSVLVVGGDTLFLKDFVFNNFFQTAKTHPNRSLVTVYSVPDEDVSKVGIIETNSKGVVTSFLEKPEPSETSSRYACPCFYLFVPNALSLLDAFIDESKGKPKEEVDATGKFLAYLFPRCPVGTFPISGRIDVGGLSSYLQADVYYKSM